MTQWSNVNFSSTVMFFEKFYIWIWKFNDCIWQTSLSLIDQWVGEYLKMRIKHVYLKNSWLYLSKIHLVYLKTVWCIWNIMSVFEPWWVYLKHGECIWKLMSVFETCSVYLKTAECIWKHLECIWRPPECIWKYRISKYTQPFPNTLDECIWTYN